MGLDSVELLVSFEKQFNIQITNQEAEKIGTVQDMVDCVAKHLNISGNETTLKTMVYERLRRSLIQNGIAYSSFSLSDKAFSIINPDNGELWMKLSKDIDLEIPKPFREADTFMQKLFYKGWRPEYDWKTITVDQLITAICADNYKKLIDPTSIKNTYEILVIIIAITSDTNGLDVYEMRPNKHFVNDLGIN